MWFSSNEPWSIEDYCASQIPSDWNALAPSSRDLLQVLNLPTGHPFCSHYDPPSDVPPQGPLLWDGVMERIIAFFFMLVPSLWAMGELWLRLLAGALGPIGIAHLLYSIQSNIRHWSVSNHNHQSIICLVTVASCAVLLTDTLYILAHGPLYGGSLLLLASSLSLWTSHQRRQHKTFYAILAILLLTLYLSVQDGQFHFGGKAERCTIPPGLYHSPDNYLIHQLRQEWALPTYKGTPWMPTGDSKTGLPFLFNQVPALSYTRVWCPLDDGEHVALDWAFPPQGYNPHQPVFFILHGLNGGSQEDYVREFAIHQLARGNTVVVMVARGLSDLPIRGWNLFHGARWTDAHQAAVLVKQALQQSTLIGVGYSMGAIVLNNWAARAGADVPLDAAMSISGSLDTRYQAHNHRAQRLWQPMLTQTLRDEFLLGKWGQRVRAKLPAAILQRLLRATHISAVDETAVVHYNGFDDLDHYYREMSALGDVPLEEYQSTALDASRRIHQIAIPFCVVHALDDPLITFRTVAANQGLLHPTNLTQTGSGHLLVWLTRGGGHVGWPVGTRSWEWMTTAATGFGEAVARTRETLELI